MLEIQRSEKYVSRIFRKCTNYFKRTIVKKLYEFEVTVKATTAKSQVP